MLEPGRTLTLAERGGEGAEVVVAAPGFRVLATMNPGGDYGKKWVAVPTFVVLVLYLAGCLEMWALCSMLCTRLVFEASPTLSIMCPLCLALVAHDLERGLHSVI